MWNIEISNVGGIRAASPALTPGVNAVQASNWQGKTSFVTAIRTVLGSEQYDSVLTEGASEGSVRLDTPDTVAEVTLTRRGDTVVLDGTPYLTDSQDILCAELFAFLDERNPVRAAVRNGDDLTGQLIEPLEQEDIGGQIQSLKTERQRVETELDEAERAKGKIPETEQQIATLKEKLAEIEGELAELKGTEDQAGDQEDLRATLTEKRQSKQRAKQRRSRLEQKIESVETQLAEKEAELEELSVPSAPELSERLETKRAELSSVEQKIETLETLYNVNKRILEKDQIDLVTEVTRQLDTDRLSCWVCGNETSRDELEQQMPALDDAVQQWRSKRQTLESDVEKLRSKQQSIDRKRRQKRSLADEIDSLQVTLDESRNELESSRERLVELSADVDRLAEQVSETDDRRESLEQSLARTEAELSDLRERQERLEQEAAATEQLRERRVELSDEIESLRSRRERVIETAREAFESALTDVVEQFDPSFESARLKKHVEEDTGKTERLELIIARDGQEISVDALSEGEVELVGIIAALAGHEAFDVADRVPCILLDDVGGLAGEHLRTMAEYLDGRAEYVLTTAYPEVGTFDGQTLSPSDWEVVSDRSKTTA